MTDRPPAQPHSQIPSHSLTQPRRWPAEWEPLAAVWFSWPHNRDTWPGLYDHIPVDFAALIAAASRYVPVKLLAAGELADVARQHLGDRREIEWVDVATNDCWIRDYGPTFVKQGNELVGVDWRFNAWGGKYPPWDDDAAAAAAICAHSNVRRLASELFLEGGGIEGDGGGRLLTTSSSVLSDSRNAGWSRERVEAEFTDKLGSREIVWLDGGGLDGDDTDGHIDQLARFVDAENVVCAVSSDPHDPNRLGLEQNYQQLVAWSQQTSPRVTVHRLPTPPMRLIGKARVPESYCNFLLLGGDAVLVPTFRQPTHDQAAIDLLQQLLPKHAVIGVSAYHFAWGLGAWHCASQQQPA